MCFVKFWLHLGEFLLVFSNVFLVIAVFTQEWDTVMNFNEDILTYGLFSFDCLTTSKPYITDCTAAEDEYKSYGYLPVSQTFFIISALLALVSLLSVVVLSHFHRRLSTKTYKIVKHVSWICTIAAAVSCCIGLVVFGHFLRQTMKKFVQEKVNVYNSAHDIQTPSPRRKKGSCASCVTTGNIRHFPGYSFFFAIVGVVIELLAPICFYVALIAAAEDEEYTPKSVASTTQVPGGYALNSHNFIKGKNRNPHINVDNGFDDMRLNDHPGYRYNERNV